MPSLATLPVSGRSPLRTGRGPEGAAALKALIDDQEIGTQALYGVGSYSRRFRDKGDVAQADALGQVLLSRLASAPNEYRVVEALRAISNSGFAGAFGKARGLLEDRREPPPP